MARKGSGKAKAPSKTTRLNIRLPTDLVEWAKTHAASNNTNVTAIIKDHLTTLRKEATSVEQI